MQVPKDTVANVARDVLETMAFAFVMPGGDEPSPPEDRMQASVRFDGPFGGIASLTLPCAIVPEIAANMLGEDGETVSEQQQRDAVGELANVMCGNLVQVLAGPKPVFNLQPPRIAVGPDVTEPSAEGDAAIVARIPLENGWAELALVLDEACAGVSVAGAEATP